MSFSSLKPFHQVAPGVLQSLENRLAEFYRQPPSSYYEIADQAAAHYTEEEQPFHCHLASQTFQGARVLELGCGTAHLCPHIEDRGGIYHGVDYGDALLQRNRSVFPNAIFWAMGDCPDDTFDLVASLYTIEHVTNPPLYLQKLWNYCKPGGLIGVICPDFIDGEGIPRSIYYGTSPGRFRSKLAAMRFRDALLHFFELKFAAPRWKRIARAKLPGAFWMNTDPSDLAGCEHGIDGDAVHFPRMIDIADWFQNAGATIEATSRSLPNIPPEVLMHNCYVLARKPA